MGRGLRTDSVTVQVPHRGGHSNDCSVGATRCVERLQLSYSSTGKNRDPTLTENYEKVRIFVEQLGSFSEKILQLFAFFRSSQ